MTSKPDISVWCPRHHLMQRFRWVVSEGVWQPVHLQSEVVAVYPDNKVGLMPVPAERDEDWTFPPFADHQRWPMRCRECNLNEPVGDGRMTTVLELLTTQRATKVPLTVVRKMMRCVAATPTTRRYPRPEKPFHRRDS